MIFIILIFLSIKFVPIENPDLITTACDFLSTASQCQMDGCHAHINT